MFLQVEMMNARFWGERKIKGKEKASIATLVKHSFLSVAVSAATHSITMHYACEDSDAADKDVQKSLILRVKNKQNSI